MKQAKDTEIEPKLLLAVQMKWYTIVIPILCDDYMSGENSKFSFVESSNISLRKLDFNKVEKEFICDMTANLIEVPKDLYNGVEEDLRKCGLLKKEMNYEDIL